MSENYSDILSFVSGFGHPKIESLTYPETDAECWCFGTRFRMTKTTRFAINFSRSE